MIEATRILTFFSLICLNYIFLSTSIWVWTPDLFIAFILFLTTRKSKLPSTYLFILYGFSIDLFFSDQSLPYTITFFLIGAYLSFSNIKWIQRSLLEQLLMIVITSIFLNILLNFINDYSLNIEARIILNPLMNALIWAAIFMTQRHKWLKNF
jgi:hypothetical protein